jgi:hypothetical protein
VTTALFWNKTQKSFRAEGSRLRLPDLIPVSRNTQAVLIQPLDDTVRGTPGAYLASGMITSAADDAGKED